MADLNYWRLVHNKEDIIPADSPIRELTMPATGDVLADVQALHQPATDMGMKQPVAQLWQYDDHGEDRFQFHNLVMQVSVQDSKLLAQYP